MKTEVWFRNPRLYIRELIDCGVTQIAWDRGTLVKHGIDAKRHADLYYGKSMPFRLLLVGEQGTAELGPNNDLDRPVAVYPTWSYGEDIALLEEIITKPVGLDMDLCFDSNIPPDERPVHGQEHRVVITHLPVSHSSAGRRMLRVLKTLQEDYPSCIIHIHGLYAFKVAFGMGFGSADVEVRTAASKGKLHTPSGLEVPYQKVQSHAHWVTALGFKPGDLDDPSMRCKYNIKSAQWAGEHYNELFRLVARNNGQPVDYTTPDDEYEEPQTSRLLPQGLKAQDGDKIACDTCSLQNKCRAFRSGAVCSLPDAQPAQLARYFQTRDSGMIIDGLGTLLATQTRRLDRGLHNETLDGEIDPAVSTLISNIFSQGVQLAKLVDPALRGGVKVNILNANGSAAASVSAATPQEMIGAVVRELEGRGIPRNKITPQMIQAVLTAAANPEGARQAIEGTLASED